MAVAYDQVLALLQSWAASDADSSSESSDGRSSVRSEILEFAEVFLKLAAGSDRDQPSADIANGVISLFEHLEVRPDAAPKVSIRGARAGQSDGDTAGVDHTVIDLVLNDSDYVIESVLLALRRHGCNVRSLMNAVVSVTRDDDGRLTDLEPPTPGGAWESVVHIEIDPIYDSDELIELEAAIDEVLDAVAVVAATWRDMKQRLLASAADLSSTDPIGGQMLTWLAQDNFLFFGASGPDGPLGLCARAGWQPLPPLEQGHPGVMVTASKTEASVHRAAPLMRISIWVPDSDSGAGTQSGSDAESGKAGGRREEYFGLFPAHVYTLPVARLPLVGKRVDGVVERAGFAPGGHNERQLRSLMEAYPREEMFQIDTETLFEHAMGLLNLRDQQRVRLFTRRSTSGRFVSILAYIPRDRFDTEKRVAIVGALKRAYGSSEPDFAVSVSDGPFARLHIRAHAPDGEVLAEVDTARLEQIITALTESWADGVAGALSSQLGRGEGQQIAAEWANGFPPNYQTSRSALETVFEIGILTALGPDDLAIELSKPAERARPEIAAPDSAGSAAASKESLPDSPDDSELRVTLYRSGAPLTLSAVLPLLQDLGMTVLDEHPYELDSSSGVQRWIYDVGVYSRSGTPSIEDRERFEAALLAVWQGEAESDGFGALVLGAGINWRDVAVLRSYRRYLRQIGSTFSQAYYEQTLLGNPEIVKLLIELFHVRFSPDLALDPDLDLDPAGDGTGPAARSAREAELASEIDRCLEGIVSLDEDRMLRSFKMLISATDRTNAFVPNTDTLSFKLDPSRIDDLPQPVPAHEIWVYAPRVEGVHLRGGGVARGGLRHSDRLEDFRTEVLGLMKAQQVKNSIIVPVGAKGGFVCHRLPIGDRAAIRTEVVACYRMFIAGLLDVTDNIVDGDIVPPVGVVRHDEDDAYLVVAADKGTATFSDFANEVSVDRGFWLGDAFASGGSTGYDHKAMGITARGAWESVRRHLFERGIDSQTDPVRVVGIGDMSGDVFGNGMLLSPSIELVAAFDHRHVFVDPTPDAATSFTERTRLFELPRSSWNDYDRSLISTGGGVFDRTAKAIDVGTEMAAALDIEPGEMTPNELMRAILLAPVDLFWNGGIGTFVKASDETHLEVGDRSNDGIRIDATDFRVKVVGEGGNLGLTQRARIEFAFHGGSINTDAIDNSAGVDTSDHEVNLKIMLNQAVTAGELRVEDRNTLLATMTDAVAEQVLIDNVEQNLALSLAKANAVSMAAVHRRVMGVLEDEAGLNREVEFLPTDEELAERARNGVGLTRPEIAVLMAYEKNRLTEILTRSDLAADPAFGSVLDHYFPAQIVGELRKWIQTHPLGTNIVATAVVNQMLNRTGLTLVIRLSEETGASPGAVLRAHRVAWRVGDIESAWQQLQDLAPEIEAETQIAAMLELRRLGERSTRWVLRHRPDLSDPEAVAAALRPGVVTLSTDMVPNLSRAQRLRLEADAEALVRSGLPAELAARVARSPFVVATLDQVDLARDSSVDLQRVAEVWNGVGQRLHLDWLERQVTALDRTDHWLAMARSASRSEVTGARRALAAAVLDGTADSPDDGSVDVWMARNRTHTDRYRSLIADLQNAETVELSHITVAVAELRDVLSRLHLTQED